MHKTYSLGDSMNFRQLEIYRAVMMSGSASRASELLEITQPAVSRSIAELEASMGFSLFDRVRGRLVPTPEGQMFFTDVVASFVGLDTLRASAARIRDFGVGQHPGRQPCSARVHAGSARYQSLQPPTSRHCDNAPGALLVCGA
jgi:DNA-binding transcriptional LysR family regulator